MQRSPRQTSKLAEIAGARRRRCASRPARCVRRAEALDRRPATHVERLLQVRFVRVDDQAAVAGHRAQQQVELPLDRRDVRIDVGVIVLEVVQDRGARPVVHELRALVEKGGVVFVRLDHEMAARAEARTDAEIERHAADQEPGCEPGVLEYPGEQAAGRRLAVRARGRRAPSDRPAAARCAPAIRVRTHSDGRCRAALRPAHCRGS